MNFHQAQIEKQKTLNRIRNGRVDIMGNPFNAPQIPLFEETNTGNHLYKKEAVSAILQTNAVQNHYFSAKNIDLLQQLMAYHVRIQSQGRHKIGRQDDNQLKIIMKSVYLMYSRNLPDHVDEQVKELNAYVLDYCVPNILSNVEQYLTYQEQVSSLPVPLEHPKYTSAAGTRTRPDFVF